MNLRTLTLFSASLVWAARLAASAPDGNRLGLFPAHDFRIASGSFSDPDLLPQALYFFQGETVALPTAAPAGFTRGVSYERDIRAWAATRLPDGDGTRPQIVWLGASLRLEGAILSGDGRTLRTPAGELPFRLAPRIPSNRAFWDASSLHALRDQALDLRGRMVEGAFEARTVWPQNFAIREGSLQPLGAKESLRSLVRAGDARAPFQIRRLWGHSSGHPLAGSPVLAVILNGAQGDDDEAHGGHFAFATGRIGPRGEWNHWLVSNFYSLDSYSEKGIIAATLPVESYMGDLNSGQAWYRPSWVLAAVLKSERAAARAQEALNRTLNHYYRHDFSYHHAVANCTGISLKSIRALGWNLPIFGPTSRLRAFGALPFVGLRDRSLAKGRMAYDYLVSEQTELHPMLAFEAVGMDLLGRLTTAGETFTTFERMLHEDLEAVLFLRVPQFPSSRAFGQAPVASLDEYLARVPKDPSQWKIIPVPPRPFPRELQDPEARTDPVLPSTYGLAGYAMAFGLTVAAGARRLLAKRKRRR
jgi:hypothetical protein